MKPLFQSMRRHSLFLLLAIPGGGLAAGCGGGDGTGPSQTIEAAPLTVNQPSFLLERGFHQALTATAKDKNGGTITIPVVWRSSNETVATLDHSKIHKTA